MIQVLQVVGLLCITLSDPVGQQSCHRYYVHCVGSLRSSLEDRLLYCISARGSIEARVALAQTTLQRMRNDRQNQDPTKRRPSYTLGDHTLSAGLERQCVPRGGP